MGVQLLLSTEKKNGRDLSSRYLDMSESNFFKHVEVLHNVKAEKLNGVQTAPPYGI